MLLRRVRRNVASLAVVLLAVASVAASAGGAEVWTAHYPGTGNGRDDPRAIAVSPDGSKVFVTGNSAGANNADFVTVAYDRVSGVEAWATRSDGGGADYGRSIAVSPDGATVFAAGFSDGATTDADYATFAYDASTGAIRWDQRYNGPPDGFDSAMDLAVTPGGEIVVVTGASEGSAGANADDYVTVAYDASTGAQLWARRYDGAGHNGDFGMAVAVGPRGARVFVTGQSNRRSGFTDYATLAYKTRTGAKLWLARYEGPATSSHDYARAIGISPGGTRVFVTGFSDGDYATVAYSAATGATRWVARYAGGSSEYAWSLAVDPGGARVFVTGESRGSDGRDFATVAYAAGSGEQLWVSRYNGLGDRGDWANAIEIDPEGTAVFVTGRSRGPTSTDFATVAYDATNGSVLWTTLWDGPEGTKNEATALAVTPDGANVIVTGTSETYWHASDYVTVSYATG